MIIGIVAISQNFAIGKDGKLPWHYSADLKFFKETTMGHAVVMGSKTWSSIGRPLPGRLNVILTRTGRVDAPGDIMKLANTDEVIELDRLINKDVYIIGGAKTFDAFRGLIEKWIVTEVPINVSDADVFLNKDTFDDFTAVNSTKLGEGLVVKTMQRK